MKTAVALAVLMWVLLAMRFIAPVFHQAAQALSTIGGF